MRPVPDKVRLSLGRLAKYLGQLRQWPENEDIDLGALAAAIAVHVAALERLVPPGTLRQAVSSGQDQNPQTSGTDWSEEFHQLAEINQECLGRMIRFREETARQLNGLRKHRKAISAYARAR